MLKTIAVVVVLAAGCGGKKEDKPAEPAKPVDPKPADPAPTPTPDPKPAEPKAAGLTIVPIKMVGEYDGKKKEMAIDAAGKVTEDGKEVGSVNAAGELTVGGKVVATIAGDGKVTIINEPQEKFAVREDGAILDEAGKVMVEIGEDGAMTGPLLQEGNRNAKITVTGDKAGRRAMMFVMMGVEAKP